MSNPNSQKMNGYDKPITRKDPSMFLFMLDCSASMSEPIEYNGVEMTKSDALSRIINITLEEIKSRCRREEGFYDYFHIAVIGYGDDTVESMLDYVIPDKQVIPISELAHADIPSVTYESLRTYEGRIIASHITLPESVRPQAAGNTPMGAAFKHVRSIVERWVSAHGDSFPPVIFNITDGECTDVTDGVLLSMAERLKSLHTSAGNVLLFNVHLTNDRTNKGILFPKRRDMEMLEDRRASLLYEMSSDLPEAFAVSDSLKGAKAMAYNTSMSELVKMINIGSISINKIQ